MVFYDEPFTQESERARDLLEILRTGFVSKDPMQDFVGRVGVAVIDVNWDRSISNIWPDAVELIARRGRLREFLILARDADVYAAFRDRLVQILTDCDAELQAEQAIFGGAVGIDHTRVTLVGRRPFVNRVSLRANLRSLFDHGGDKVLIVNGPPSSGRSYTWVLISYVARRLGGFDAKLIDLSKFSDTQATPADVARMIAASMGWPAPDADETAMDVTNARVLGTIVKQKLSGTGKVCLVFDGLDGANLAESTLEFVSSLASAAGNDELGDCRVVLLAFDRPLSNPNVDPFVPRDPTVGDLPLSDLVTYFQAVAAENGKELTDAQAKAMADTLFGPPAPDPLPMSMMRDKAGDLSRAAVALRGL